METTYKKSRSNLVGNVAESLDLQGFAGFWRRANLRDFVCWRNRAKDVSGGRIIRNRGLGILHERLMVRSPVITSIPRSSTAQISNSPITIYNRRKTDSLI